MSQVIAQASSVTSPTSHTIGTRVEVPLPDTIPIIFIPGIMGSNICTKKDKIPVWRLGNGLPSLFWNNVLEQRKKSPAQLQTELNPQSTEVDRNGPMGGIACNIDRKTLRKRGWGTVHWDSYGGILVYLQQQLNKVQLKQKDSVYFEKQSLLEWPQILQADEQSQWGATSALKKIAESDLEHLQDFNFPVYAMGYNWLQSNEDGANNIAQQLDKIKQEYGKYFHKFIIVTHSMGGLLTRRLVQLKEADIAGVVHGVMPAEGAALAYRRIVTGCAEGGFKSWLGSYVMGPHTEHTTAVIANSPGSLELLPTPRYNHGKPWLILKGKDHNHQSYQVRLPKQNPYQEIYKSDAVWWEMVKEELIDPAKTIKVGKSQRLKDFYFDKIDDVEKFHNKIANHYHPCTYVNYGYDQKQKSFENVTWTLNQPVKGLTESQLLLSPRASQKQLDATFAKKANMVASSAIHDKKIVDYNDKELGRDHDGIRYIALENNDLTHFSVSMQDSFGDGTVPHASSSIARGQNGVRQVFQMQGFDHQGSYGNKHVRRSVLYSIVQIIKANNIQPKYV